MRMRKRQNLQPRMEACGAVWLRDTQHLRGNWRSLMPDARELRLEAAAERENSRWKPLPQSLMF